MTGFSSKNLVLTLPNTATGVHITMTLKSLNSRFFEANCKLPYAFTQLETELIKRFKSKLNRGNVYFTLHMANPEALVSVVEPSIHTISSYLDAINSVKDQFKLPGEFMVSDLLRLPDIFPAQENQFDQTATDIILLEVDNLIKQLNETRQQEGSVLAQDLHQRIKKIKSYMQELEPRAEQVMKERKQQVHETIKAMLAESNQENLGDAQNMLLHNQLDKIDIHEEIVRFNSHLDNLFNCLESPCVEKGKKLDFTLQELFREINTMAAKCSDAQISGLAINIKVELEKAREQTQNIV